MTTAGVAAATNYPAGCWGPPDLRPADAVLDLRLMLAPLDSLPELTIVTPVDDLTELPEVIDVTLELQLEPGTPHLSFIDELVRLLHHYLQHPGVLLRPAQHDALAALGPPRASPSLRDAPSG